MELAPEGPPGAPPKTNRAGRDLSRAIPVGVALGVIVSVSVAFIPRLWYVVVAGAVALGLWEVYKRLQQAGFKLPLIPLMAGGQAVVWLSWPYDAYGAFGALAISVVILMIWRLFLGGLRAAPENYLRDTSVTVFVLSWIAVMGACAAMVVDADRGGRNVVALIVCVVCSDVGGYVAGVLFGKHPMAPKISPKKSWEGLAGSVLFGMVGGVLLFILLLDENPVIGAVFGLAVVFAATLGDLVESQFKRDLGIKDMGTLLPGHGGMMDRVDSVLPASVMAWVFFQFVV